MRHETRLQRLVLAVLVLSGTLSQLVSYTGFAVVLFSAVAVAAVFDLRIREPEAPRPFRAWGYPWAPALFCTVGFAIVLNTIVQAPGVASAGLGVMTAGVPIYWWMRSSGPAKRR